MASEAARLTVGNVEIVAIPDGAGPSSGVLTELATDEPGARWWALRDHYPEMFDDQDRWHIHNNCYLVHSQGRSILVDTGVGERPYKRYGGIVGVLPSAFERAGATFDEIDTVLMTHAHPDHVGWNVTPDGAATFPNARYLLHEADWREFALHASQGGNRERVPNYAQRSLVPLEALGVLDLFADEQVLTDELRQLHTPGHTAGHVSVLIASAGERAVITGDVFSNPAYITEPDLEFSADIDVEQGKATRHALLERIEAEGMRVIGGHFDAPGFGHVVKLEGKRYWRAF
ncbi:MAG TPA: MBL fold metallo-hydrolase [Dehalococcoidia bacterium]|nr:MBL fold metallo-hydrolase [Dehalococcoidia bacterium]